MCEWSIMKGDQTNCDCDFFCLFLLFVVGGGREKLLTKYGQVRVTDCEYIKHRQVSISVGEDRPAVSVAVHVTKMSQSAQRNQKRSAIFHSHLKCARSSKHHNITPSRFIIIFLSLFSSFFIFWKRVMMKFCVRSFVFVKYLL